MSALAVMDMVTSDGTFLVVGMNLKVWIFVVFNVAVDSSKDGGECFEVVGRDTLNSISSLFSVLKKKVEKVIVQVLFSLCSKHPIYFICCLMMKRDTSREGRPYLRPILYLPTVNLIVPIPRILAVILTSPSITCSCFPMYL